MGLLRDRRQARIQRRGNVQKVLESLVDESLFSEEELQVLHSHYGKIMEIAEAKFPTSEDGDELKASLEEPQAQKTYGSITTIILVIKILMILYSVYKQWKANKA